MQQRTILVWLYFLLLFGEAIWEARTLWEAMTLLTVERIGGRSETEKRSPRATMSNKIGEGPREYDPFRSKKHN